MFRESFLLKSIIISNQSLSFGEVLLSKKLFQKLDIEKLQNFDEKIIALRFMLLNMVSVVNNKNRMENIDKFWLLIDKERKRDSRVTKTILKNLGVDSFYYYNERKAKKLTIRESIVSFELKFLEGINRVLQSIRYKIDEHDYLLQREMLLVCMRLLFKTKSEYGYQSVLKSNNVGIFAKLYKDFPELEKLKVSSCENPEKTFKMMVTIWDITKNPDFLSDLDIAFERLKNNKGLQKGNIVEDKLAEISKQGFASKLPYYERFKKTKNYLEFVEHDVYEWSLDINTLKKWSVGDDNVSLPYFRIKESIDWVESCGLFFLELLKPLKKIYIDSSKINVYFIFNKPLIKNDELFEKYWLRLIEFIFLEPNKDENQFKIELLNKEYLLDMEIPKSSIKSKLTKF